MLIKIAICVWNNALTVIAQQAGMSGCSQNRMHFFAYVDHTSLRDVLIFIGFVEKTNMVIVKQSRTWKKEIPFKPTAQTHELIEYKFQ